MYEIKKYVCDYDGKEFDDEEECEKYEFSLHYQDVLKNNEIQMFDCNLDPTDSAEYTVYFRCLTENAAHYFVDLNEYEGMCYYPDFKDIEIGEVYYFDDDKEEYVAFKKLTKPVLEMMKLFDLKLEEISEECP